MDTLYRLLIAASVLLVAACGTTTSTPAPGGQPSAGQPSRQAAPPPAAPTGYDDPTWQTLVAAARPEGKLVLASGPNPDTRVRLPAAFKERFGVDVEYLAGRTSELQTRLASERAAGVYSVDLLISGGDSAAAMYNDGWFAPIRPQLVVPEVRDPAAFRNNRYPFLDPQDQYLFELEADLLGFWIVNPEIVPDGAITRLDDLLDPRWRGKISVEDPLVAGQGLNCAVYIYLAKGEDWFRRLYVDQQPAVSRDDRQLQDWLARGQYPITFGLTARDVDDMTAQGLPAKLLGTLDGTGAIVGGFGVLAQLSNGPHPNAAKLFVNWIASPEGAALHAETEGQVPLRKDVPHPWVKEAQVPKEGVTYRDLYDYKYITEEKPAIIRRMREILGQ
jgi:ABC-type Fe3+ transport system substrate-binding protein